MMKQRIPVSIVLVLIVLISSCTAGRKAIREPIREQGPEFLMNKLKENEIKFSTFSAKFAATYIRDRKKTDISGQIRIRRDSVIWISITPLMGIEMARFVLTPDSIKYLNRISTTYMVKEFRYFNQLFNKTLDFDMAQAFLTGNDFSLYENNTFRASVDNGEYKLSTSNRRKLKRFVRRSEEEISIPLQSIWLNPDHFKINRVVLKEAERDPRKFAAEYSGFEQTEGQKIPANLQFRIETDKEKIGINVQYSRVHLDEELSFPFVIPDSYIQINDFIIK
jgi:hypothetical protein